MLPDPMTQMLRDTANRLADTLRAVPCDMAWLEQAGERLEQAGEPGKLLAVLSPQVRFRLGVAPLAAPASLETAHGALNIGHWLVEDAARLYLLLKALLAGATDGVTLLNGYFRLCDDAEKASLVRGIALLDASDGLKPLALDCGRTNSQMLFAALALHNPYPASVYTDPEFNQLVLKGLFMDIGIHDMDGLDKRANPELSRMCEDYYNERSAAGRDVPPDIWLALGPHAGERGVSLIIEALGSDDARHRYCAAQALAARLPEHPEYGDFLRARLRVEKDKSIIKLLERLLG